MESDWIILLALFIFLAGLGSVFFDVIFHDRKSTSRKQAKPTPDSLD